MKNPSHLGINEFFHNIFTRKKSIKQEKIFLFTFPFISGNL